MFNKTNTIIFTLSISMLSSGCATMMWNKWADDKLVPAYEEYNANTTISSKFDYHVRLQKGRFNGIKEHDGKQYYNYVIPDVFRDSESNGIEIMMPLGGEDNKARITQLDTINRDGAAVYVIYKRSVGYQSQPGKPTVSLEYCAPNPLGLDKDFPVNYPVLMGFCLPEYGSSAFIFLGQKLNAPDQSDIDENLLSNSYRVCQRPGFQVTFEPADNTTSVGKDATCEWWYWRSYISNAYDPGRHRRINVLRIAGYVATVPIDVVTSPMQLLFYIIYPTPRWGP